MVAKWIAPQNSCEGDCHFQVRKLFQLSRLPARAEISVCAESHYILLVNGIEARRGPARGTHTVNYYDTADISPFLREGENELLINCHCMNIETFVAAPSEPAVIAELQGFFGTDESWDSREDARWRKDVQLYTFQTGYSEWLDFRIQDSGWSKARIISPESLVLKKMLRKRDVPALNTVLRHPADIPMISSVGRLDDCDERSVARRMTREPLTPLDISVKPLLLPESAGLKIESLPDNAGLALIVDFAHEVIGRFELDVTAPSGTIIDIGYEEELWNGRLQVERLSNEAYKFADRYITDGRRRTVGNVYQERGFRMVQVHIRNFKESVTIHSAKALDIRYPFTNTASFICDDEGLSRLFLVCAETLSACTTDVYTDCPWRERALWLNDMIVENRTGLQLYGDPRVNARVLRMAVSDAFPEGLIPGVCPCPRSRESCILPLTNLFLPEILRDYFLYTGDAALVHEILPALLKAVRHISTWEDSDGILYPPGKYWNFFEWSYELNGVSLNGKQTSLLNYYYHIALREIKRLDSECGCNLELSWMEERLQRLPAAIEKRFFSEEHGMLMDTANLKDVNGRFSQVAHAFALLAECGSPKLRQAASAAISNPALLEPDLYFQSFIFRALELVGRPDESLARIRKHWLKMLQTGTPTLWEAWVHQKGKAAMHGDGSLCHGFATIPVDFLQTTVLGIRPLTPGFKTFRVSPNPFDLSFAEGRVPTPAGNIWIRWELVNGSLAVSLRIPFGLIAKTPAGDFSSGLRKFTVPIPCSSPN